jgi:hypothetical protein
MLELEFHQVTLGQNYDEFGPAAAPILVRSWLHIALQHQAVIMPSETSYRQRMKCTNVCKRNLCYAAGPPQRILSFAS